MKTSEQLRTELNENYVSAAITDKEFDQLLMDFAMRFHTEQTILKKL